jgi:hypothetical protein
MGRDTIVRYVCSLSSCPLYLLPVGGVTQSLFPPMSLAAKSLERHVDMSSIPPVLKRYKSPFPRHRDPFSRLVLFGWGLTGVVDED